MVIITGIMLSVCSLFVYTSPSVPFRPGVLFMHCKHACPICCVLC